MLEESLRRMRTGYDSMLECRFYFLTSLHLNLCFSRFSDRDMVIRFFPGLGLSHVTDPNEEWISILDEGDPDWEDDGVVDPFELDLDTIDNPDSMEDLEVGSEEEEDYAREIADYGYEEDEPEEPEEEEIEEENAEDVDIGPEDGEEPINHDMEVYDEEGYGLF